MGKKFMIATHGQLASGFQNALTILADKGSDVVIIDAYVTDEDYTSQILSFIEEVGKEEQAIIFTDLLGGSVNQRVVTEVMLSKKEQLFVVSNSNLAIILTLMLTPDNEQFSQESIEQAINECAVCFVNTKLTEENFF